MKVISKVYETKANGKWELINDCSGEKWHTYITEELATDLAAKYVQGAAWVKRIVRKQYYSHQEYTVYYDNDNRAVYTVQNG